MDYHEDPRMAPRAQNRPTDMCAAAYTNTKARLGSAPKGKFKHAAFLELSEYECHVAFFKQLISPFHACYMLSLMNLI